MSAGRYQGNNSRLQTLTETFVPMEFSTNSLLLFSDCIDHHLTMKLTHLVPALLLAFLQVQLSFAFRWKFYNIFFMKSTKIYYILNKLDLYAKKNYIYKMLFSSGFNTPLNGWYKYACTAENIKVIILFSHKSLWHNNFNLRQLLWNLMCREKSQSFALLLTSKKFIILQLS